MLLDHFLVDAKALKKYLDDEPKMSNFYISCLDDSELKKIYSGSKQLSDLCEQEIKRRLDK